MSIIYSFDDFLGKQYMGTKEKYLSDDKILATKFEYTHKNTYNLIM